MKFAAPARTGDGTKWGMAMDGSSYRRSWTAPPLDELKPAAADTETLFLAVGEHLGHAATALGTMTEVFGALRERLETPELVHAIACLEQAATGIAAIGRRNAGSLAELEQMEATTILIRSRLARLCKTISEVRLLSINARIESALVADSTVDFTVFTHEIGRLSGLAEEGLGQLGQELAALGSVVGEARGGRQRFEQTQRDSLGMVGDRIGRSLATAETHRHEASEAVTAIADKARQIGARVGAAVMALQIGDISRQRIEHVCEALTGLDDPAAMGADMALSEEARSSLTARLCHLQAAQLIGTADELDDGACVAMANLGALIDEAGRVQDMGSRVFGGADREHGSFLLELAEQMRNAEALIRGYASARANTETLVHAVSDRVSAMVSHVQAVHSIEIDLRIMGLNATLKCNRLGTGGRALSVIAQTLRTYAGSTVADAGELMAGLEAVIATARGLGTHSDGDDGGTALADLMAAMSVAAGVLKNTGTDMADALMTLAGVMSDVTTRLDDSTRRLKRVKAIASTLRGVAGRLTDAAGGVMPDDGLSEIVLGQLAERYTMARERETHLSHTNGEGFAPTQASADAFSVDDVLF